MTDHIKAILEARELDQRIKVREIQAATLARQDRITAKIDALTQAGHLESIARAARPQNLCS